MPTVESLSVELHNDPARELGSLAVFDLFPEHAASMTEQSFYAIAHTVNAQADPFLARRARPEHAYILSGDVEFVDFEVDFETLLPIRAIYRVITAGDVKKIQNLLAPDNKNIEVDKKAEIFNRLIQVQQAAARQQQEVDQSPYQPHRTLTKLRRVASGVAARIRRLYHK